MGIVMTLVLGVICGFFLSLFFSIGPAFFKIIANGLQYGSRRTFFVALGIFASDAFIVFLLLTLLKGLNMSAILHNPWVAVIAALVLTYLGWRMIHNKKEVQEEKVSSVGSDRPLRLFWDGFLTNFPNPGVWIFWGAVISFSLGELFADNPLRAYLFFAGLLGTSLVVDTSKGFLASRLRNIMSRKRIGVINKIAGCIYICFSAYLVISMLVFNLDPQAQERQLKQEQNPQAVQAFKQIDKGLKDVQKISDNYIGNK